MSGADTAAARCWWPAGLAELSPAERAKAVARGWWRDGECVVFVDGERVPVDELRSRAVAAAGSARLAEDRARRLTEAAVSCTAT